MDDEAVYAAELAAFDGTDLEDVVDFEQLCASMTAVMGGDWWTGPSVEVRAARSDASTSRCIKSGGGDRTEIRLARPQTTVATAAHELAHALAGAGAGHGPLFRAAYLDVVAVITNIDTTDRRHDLHVDQLATAFSSSGLAVARRRWPPPPSSTTSAIAL